MDSNFYYYLMGMRDMIENVLSEFEPEDEECDCCKKEEGEA